MNNWQEDLLQAIESAADTGMVFDIMAKAARALDFDYCAYGIKVSLPISRPNIHLYNNYPVEWRRRYVQQQYLKIDPTVAHGRRSQTPLVWSDAVFAHARALWDDARDCGLRYGWAQSSLDSVGVGGMLTLARSANEIRDTELKHSLQQMRWLVYVAHVAMSKLHRPQSIASSVELTIREVEVLKWTADGKSAQDIADILSITKHTVDFHIHNCVSKLGAANKTAAAVQAALLGLLN